MPRADVRGWTYGRSRRVEPWWADRAYESLAWRSRGGGASASRPAPVPPAPAPVRIAPRPVVVPQAVKAPAVEIVKVQAPGALDRNGKPFELDADGLLAICIQHELDHLDGKLFVDYLSELKRNRIRRKLEKDKRNRPATGERIRTPAI